MRKTQEGIHINRRKKVERLGTHVMDIEDMEYMVRLWSTFAVK